ncbi:MAG: TonB-dependent receptor domain-containing protein [Pseudomonadota bacterium]
MAETADEALSAVSVIDREEIEERQPQSTFDLLRTETGVDVTRNGGRGSNNSVFLRGAESDHTLVLVDGMRAASATTGQFSWRSLSPAQIQRMEVVRGPRASLYGSDAIGGVIQVFTRELDGPRLRAVAGSDGNRRVEAGFGGGDEVRYGANFGYERSDGFPSKEEGEGVQEDHGYRSRNASGYLKAPVTEDAQINVRFWANDGDVEYNAGSSETGFQETQNVSTRVALEQSLGNSWSHELGIGYSEDQTEDFGGRSDNKHDRIRTRRSSVDWRHDLSLTQAQTLQFGADFREERVLSEDRVAGTEDFDETLGNIGVFGLWRGAYPMLEAEASVRHDDDRDFGSKTTWQLAGAVPLSDRVRIRTSGGTAFKAPSANELYSPGVGGLYAGNRDLDPEESRSAEVGLRYQDSDKEKAALNLFVTRIDDLIAYQGQNLQAVNVNEAEIRGVEAEYGRSLKDWDMTLSATFQRAENRKSGERLLRRPDEKASLILGHNLNARTRLTLEGKVASERPDRNRTLPGYGIINLAATRRLESGIRLEARIENLTNKEYQLADTYNTQDLAGFVGISWEPGR